MPFPIFLAQHHESALNFNCSVTFFLFKQPKTSLSFTCISNLCLGKWPVTAQPEISMWPVSFSPSKAWWKSPSSYASASLPMETWNSILFPSAQQSAHGIFIDQSRTNWGTGPSVFTCRFPIKASEPLPTAGIGNGEITAFSLPTYQDHTV